MIHLEVVATRHGVVTVGGKARNTAEKDLVTKLINDIKGGEERKEPDEHWVVEFR